MTALQHEMLAVGIPLSLFAFNVSTTEMLSSMFAFDVGSFSPNVSTGVGAVRLQS